MGKNDLPLIVNMDFYVFYREVYPNPQVDKKHIKKRKTPVIGDIIQSVSYEDLIKGFDEAYYNDFFK